MTALITTLIDKLDTFELIRDQIAAILAIESANQQALATAGGKDPKLWKLRVFTERANPWEEFPEDPDTRTTGDTSPIVNVWYDRSEFDLATSNTIERQKSESMFNIDCYGFGFSKAKTGGHVPGDQAAALEAQRALRLVRNILMAGQYTYLDLRGLVWRRWPQTMQSFQPAADQQPVARVQGVRLALSVHFNEFSPQYVGQTLELVSTQFTRASNGQLLFQADYPIT